MTHGAFLSLLDLHTHGAPQWMGRSVARGHGEPTALLSVCAEDPKVPVTLHSSTRLLQFSHRGPGPGSGHVEF